MFFKRLTGCRITTEISKNHYRAGVSKTMRGDDKKRYEQNITGKQIAGAAKNHCFIMKKRIQAEK
jgi:hypothetical protein